MRSASLISLLLFAFHAQGQRVINVTAEQQGQVLEINYALEYDGAVNVDLFVSTDQGKSWQGPLSNCSGDVGVDVTAGVRKRILWTVLEERELVGDGIRFKVAANAANTGTRLNPRLNYGVVSDIDGNSYATIRIGQQVWMAENLRTTRYRDGSAIPNVSDESKWQNIRTGAWAYYDNSTMHDSTYGKLYNWFVVSDRRNICPNGWHIPSDVEWNTLVFVLGGPSTAGGKLKSFILWDAPNSGATNNSGFSAIPSGNLSSNGNSYQLGANSFWWSSSEAGMLEAWGRSLASDDADVQRRSFNVRNGFCLRCVRD